MCELFVQKDSSKSIAEQDAVKKRLLIWPRGHFKSTLDECDAVQWLLNFPDIRVNLMTGTLELAKRMIGNLKRHFQENVKLRALFPEYCAPQGKDFGTAFGFTLPNRKVTNLREPSVSVSTIESGKTGSHYDVIKCDDLVTEINSATQEQLQKVIDQFQYVWKLIEPYGYVDVIGTRYDHSDLYGFILDNNDGDWRTHMRKCWAQQPDGSLKLLFPERFTVDWLKQQRKANPYIFNCQYLNDPTPTDNQSFTPELIEGHTIPHAHIPRNGRVFITWDLGFSKKEYADFSVGAVGLYDELGRLFILDIDMGRFTPYELVQHFFSLLTKWRPSRVGIEKAGGSELLEPALAHYAREHNIYLPLDWMPTHPGNRKIERIAGLEALLRQDKLFFSAAIPCRDELMKQFTRFPRYKHDDAPDAISMLLTYRSAIDIAWPADQVEMGGVTVLPGSELLGAGING